MFQLPFKLGAKENPEELPAPEELVGALAAFPPRLSVLQRVPALPEAMFERMVYEQTKVSVPPGPNRLALMAMESFESMLPAFKLPMPASEGLEGKAEKVGKVEKAAPIY